MNCASRIYARIRHFFYPDDQQQPPLPEPVYLPRCNHSRYLQLSDDAVVPEQPVTQRRIRQPKTTEVRYKRNIKRQLADQPVRTRLSELRHYSDDWSQAREEPPVSDDACKLEADDYSLTADAFLQAFNDQSGVSRKLPPGDYQIGDNSQVYFHTRDLDRLKKKIYTTQEQENWLNTGLVECTQEICTQRQALLTSTGEQSSCSFLHPLFMDSQVLKNQLPRGTALYNRAQEFTCSRIFIPCNINKHWFLLMVDNDQRRIYSVDSLSSCTLSDKALDLQIWLIQLFQKAEMHDWVEHIRSYRCDFLEIPRQQGEDDCGVAMIWAIDKLSRQADQQALLTEQQNPYTKFRGQIKHTLVACSQPRQIIECEQPPHPAHPESYN